MHVHLCTTAIVLLATFGDPAFAAAQSDSEPTMTRVPHEPGTPVPPGGQRVGYVRKGLAAPGGAVLVAFYGWSVLAGAMLRSDDDPADDPSGGVFVPLVGGAIGAATTKDDFFSLTLAVSTVLQAAGLVMLLVGVLAKRWFIEFPARDGDVEARLSPGGFDLRLRF